jgi:hypothetical protein
MKQSRLEKTLVLRTAERDLLKRALGCLFNAIPDGTEVMLDKDTAALAQACGEFVAAEHPPPGEAKH